MTIGIHYLSMTGNTEMAAGRLARAIGGSGVSLRQAGRDGIHGASGRDCAGFAFPVFCMGIPPAFERALSTMEAGHEKPAFILATYGIMAGKAIPIAKRLLEKKGYRVFDAHALKMPESYPPFIARGFTVVDAPDAGELARFDAFAARIRLALSNIEAGRKPKTHAVNTGFWDMIIPVGTRKKNVRALGRLSVDAGSCIGCGGCAERCPAGAISMRSMPEFDMSRCEACFSCLNLCPGDSISASELKTRIRYRGHDNALEEKMAR